MTDFSSQTAAKNLLDIFERAVGGVHQLHGELIELSTRNPEETPHMVGRLLDISDKFAATNATIAWATALNTIVSLHGDKSAHMDRIDAAIARFNDAHHGQYATAFENTAEEWRLTLRTTQALILQ